MADYHVLSMEEVGGPVTDHGVALSLEEVPWAAKQLWAPDAAYANGQYYLFFPARDRQGIFRLGVATSKHPAGPFTAEPQPIPGSYSIDPCSFIDDDGQAYLYFGGLWGGQLQNWQNGRFVPDQGEPNGAAHALNPRVGVLRPDLLAFAEPVREVQILDEQGAPLRADDHERRFFEAAWLHKHKGLYYFSYSTGDTHLLAYATGTSPLGPFTYRGTLLTPVVGWTTHHSIVQYRGHWYLFYHDSSLSGGADHLRCVKMQELFHEADGSIRLMQP